MACYTPGSQTIELFLTALGRDLQNQDEADPDLIDIVKDHILKTSPNDDAVSRAKTAIVELAQRRAVPPKADDPNG
jgi:hypothetical protein